MLGPKYTQAQREMFFPLIDRGVTVRAAAKAAGGSRGCGLLLVAAVTFVDAACDRRASGSA